MRPQGQDAGTRPEGIPLEDRRMLYSPQMVPRQSEKEVSKDMLIVWWLAVLVGVAECGMMGTCRPMSSLYMFPTSAQQYSIIPTTPIIHHHPPLYQQRPYAPMSIQRLSSIPGDCFRSINQAPNPYRP